MCFIVHYSCYISKRYTNFDTSDPKQGSGNCFFDQKTWRRTTYGIALSFSEYKTMDKIQDSSNLKQYSIIKHSLSMFLWFPSLSPDSEYQIA